MHPGNHRINYGSMTYSLFHIVRNVNNNKKYKDQWCYFLIQAIRRGDIPMSPWLIEELEDQQFKYELIREFCVRAIGGANEQERETGSC